MGKVLETRCKRFGSKIFSLEESKDLKYISIAELMCVVQAQEQMSLPRLGKASE